MVGDHEGECREEKAKRHDFELRDRFFCFHDVLHSFVRCVQTVVGPFVKGAAYSAFGAVFAGISRGLPRKKSGSGFAFESLRYLSISVCPAAARTIECLPPKKFSSGG